MWNTICSELGNQALIQKWTIKFAMHIADIQHNLELYAVTMPQLDEVVEYEMRRDIESSQ